jgi:plastocyanin
MDGKRLLILAVFCLFSFSSPTHAVTHNVSIGDNFFSPNDLTINVGDTVRWTYSGGRMHDATADDFSWASPTSSSIDFSHTFNSVEEVLYHCTVHSTPGRDIDTRMNGRINVTQADEPPPDPESVTINGGMSDAWFNPLTDGQGMLIIAWENIEFMFMAWFTFDTVRPPEDVMAILGEPGHRWLTASGPYTGDTATLDVFLTSGGVFDAAEPPANTDPEPIGTVTIKWTGCNAGVATYNIPSLGLMGDIPIERIVLENVPLCEAGQAKG